MSRPITSTASGATPTSSNASRRAASSGVVTRADVMGGYGLAVEIDHGYKISTLYAHNDTVLVTPGQVVQAGQVVSTVGMTGQTTGPHLHFELKRNGIKIDPMRYLPRPKAAKSDIRVLYSHTNIPFTKYTCIKSYSNILTRPTLRCGSTKKLCRLARKPKSRSTLSSSLALSRPCTTSRNTAFTRSKQARIDLSVCSLNSSVFKE